MRWIAVICLLAGVANAQEVSAQDMTPELRGRVDAAIRQVVESTGVPSASVGIVRGGHIVMTAAYGKARLSPPLESTPAMAYPIGSISKQFTASCILLLEQDGKLKLDDTVSRWFPELTQANEVTVRELLSHTSGYEDYAPQDYTIPAWMQPNDPHALVETWAKKPLDFAPGTQWQYSNTNFVLAALIVEKASGMPYFDFLRTRVLQPAGITEALNLDTDRAKLQVQGYERHALAPLRPAVLEAPGWYFGDASLAMPVADLLRWDISILGRTVLSPASYAAFESEVKLKDGKGTSYGLGITVRTHDGKRMLEHSGEVGGFVAENVVFPDDGLAVAVLTNQEASPAAQQIARAVLPLLLTEKKPEPAPHTAAEDQVKTILNGLTHGQIDRSLFTPDANFYFSPETMTDFSSSLGPLGSVTSVIQQQESLRGGMTERSFVAVFSDGASVSISTYVMPDGKLEQFLVTGKL
ncbi:beta-lactamase family protein [Granulicella sp. WH15]|uniref:serine hydrolase domain-containing protein n=1 Tax=Granulicella sp. WH15 TaxID=2602070 RepID=UPI00136789A3|nr:serine hydrolase domain-containing protein [Granulicella sp. WH15]QHN02475.1 beta-lactamase family protein [Granulicella sp. WH15]